MVHPSSDWLAQTVRDLSGSDNGDLHHADRWTGLLLGLATRRRFWVVALITKLTIAVVLGPLAYFDSPQEPYS